MAEGIHVLGGGTIPVKEHPSKKMRFKMGGDWGNRIQQMEWPKKDNDNLATVVGWKNPKPRVGDELEVPMESGKMLLCKFVKVKNCNSPTDMFFADIKPIRYLD